MAPKTSPRLLYDAGGVAKYVRLASIVYPDTNRQIDYNYDTGPQAAIDEVMSRLSSISEDSDTLAAYRYLGAGTIVEEDYQDIDVKLSYLDGSDDVTGFDRFGRIAEQVWEDYSGTPTVIDEYTYTYDRAGNRTTRTNETKGDSSLDETYTYDDLDRLETMDRADGFDQDWTLDGAGNFSEFYDDSATAQTRSVNEANEIESIGGAGSWVTPAYDAAGNMISGPLAGSETTKIHYIYDAWNRLVAVKEDDSGSPGDTIAAYEYDGANRRIIKTLADNASVEYYYNQNWQLLEERFIDEYSATTAVNQYVWSQQYIDSPIVRFHDGNADGDCDPTTDADDTIRYYTWDANHNVTTTITISHDASPPYTTTTIEHYVYTAYGEATVYTEGWVEVGPPSEDGPLYCGYFFDAETDNHLARNRYYHSTLSTWISRDPIQADWNLYRYCGNSPLTNIDPLGLDKEITLPDGTTAKVPDGTIGLLPKN